MVIAFDPANPGGTRKNFEHSLADLEQDILRLGSLVERAIDDSVKALVNQDIKLAEKVIDNDEQLDELAKFIENQCMVLIATQQPMAKDLRRIGTGFRIITDLERMGDLAVDVARITIKLAGEDYVKPLTDIPRMATLTQAMVGRVLDAYVEEDVELAKEACQSEDIIDGLYREIFQDLLEIMKKTPAATVQSTHILFAARALERIGDHATNIAEGIVYLETGNRLNLNK